MILFQIVLQVQEEIEEEVREVEHQELAGLEGEQEDRLDLIFKKKITLSHLLSLNTNYDILLF